MDNRNIYQPTPVPNGFYPYTYPAATTTYARPDSLSYILPQVAPAAGLKGRPVSSFEEARVAQIDLDGSLTFFPDIANKKIYTKRINPDGTAAVLTYTLEEKSVDMMQPTVVSRDEFNELKKSVDALVAQLS